MALGRGLSSLIPTTNRAIAPSVQSGGVQHVQQQSIPSRDIVLHLPLEKIQPNAFQPRRTFEDAPMQDLANSIAQKGILQPIVVVKMKNPIPGGAQYQIIAGERRWRASKIAGLKEIPAIIKEVETDKEALELAILENIQREDLNPIELALAYKQLAGFGLSTQDIATQLGKSGSVVTNTIRLLNLPENIQADVRTGVISENHARAILSVPTEEMRLKLWREVKENKMTARSTEVASRRYKNIPSRSAATLDAISKDVVVRLEAYLGTKVLVEPNKDANKGGKIVLHYFNNDDLNALAKKITRE